MIKFLKRLFTRTHRYRVILKNGVSIYVTAADYTINYNTSTGQVNKWEFSGIAGRNYPVYIIPSEIVAIVRG